MRTVNKFYSTDTEKKEKEKKSIQQELVQKSRLETTCFVMSASPHSTCSVVNLFSLNKTNATSNLNFIPVKTLLALSVMVIFKLEHLVTFQRMTRLTMRAASSVPFTHIHG